MFQMVEFKKTARLSEIKSTRSNSIFSSRFLPLLYDRYGTIDFKNDFYGGPRFF